jgi:hypothetical protein
MVTITAATVRRPTDSETRRCGQPLGEPTGWAVEPIGVDLCTMHSHRI